MLQVPYEGLCKEESMLRRGKGEIERKTGLFASSRRRDLSSWLFSRGMECSVSFCAENEDEGLWSFSVLPENPSPPPPSLPPLPPPDFFFTLEASRSASGEPAPGNRFSHLQLT
ncbi:uncharacterized [Tachysurus ichikawai]